MKKSIVIILAALLVVNISMFGQSKKKSKKNEQPVIVVDSLKTFNDSINYVFGLSMHKNFVSNNFEISPKAFIRGFNDAQNGVDTLFTEDELKAIMTTFQMQMQEKMNAEQTEKLEKTKNEGAAFLEANKTKEGVIVTASGLQYQIIKEGVGESPTQTDSITANYEGSLLDGTVFDSSFERGEPISFPLNRVISGWIEGVQLMNPGAVYMFYIPSELAYGDTDQGPIPGGSTLIFKVELISFVKGTEE